MGTWARFENDFAEHPKWVGLSDPAFRLGVKLICWARRWTQSGFIKVATVHEKGGGPKRTRRLVGELVDAGKPEHEHGILELRDGGWQIHDFHQYGPPSQQETQPPAELIPETDPQLSAKRAAAGRRGGRLSAEQRKQNQANRASKTKQTGQAKPSNLLPPPPHPLPVEPGTDPGKSPSETGVYLQNEGNLTGGARPHVSRVGSAKTAPGYAQFGNHFRDRDNTDADVAWAWDRYREILELPNARLDDVRALTIRELLLAGATHQDIEDVLLEVSTNEWYQADRHRQQVSFIFGRRERYEALLEEGRERRARREKAARTQARIAQSHRPEVPDEERVPMSKDVEKALSAAVEAWKP